MVSRYTTDGGSREALEKGTIRGDAVFSGKFFSPGDIAAKVLYHFSLDPCFDTMLGHILLSDGIKGDRETILGIMGGL